MLIGITGPAYAGKSAVANGLVSRLSVDCLGGSYSILPFAKPLKDIARWFGWDGKKDDRGRRFLQILGTEIGRCYNPSFWVDKWIEGAVGVSLSTSGVSDLVRTANVISDDARFDNEVAAISNNGGIVVCVNASLETRRRRAEAKGEQLPPQHASEEWQSLYRDIMVMNEDGELDAVISRIIHRMEEMKHERRS